MLISSTPPSQLCFKFCSVQNSVETALKTTSKLAKYPSLANAKNVTDAPKLRVVGVGNACQYSQNKNIGEIFPSLKSHIFRFSTRYIWLSI